MTSSPDWSLYRSFLAVADTGSLSAAARRLGATQPTIGRHIAALEGALGGGALFTRSPSGLQATEAALALKPHAQAMAAAAEALVRTASGEAQSEGGVIRLTASEIVGAEVLPSILTDFREKHPGTVIELRVSNTVDDLSRREADIAVRMAPPTQSALVAKKVGEVELGFYAAPAYIARHGAPLGFEELKGHPVIGFDSEAYNIRDLPGLNMSVSRETFSFRTDSDMTQLAALSAGFGVGVTQPAIARRRGLVRVMSNVVLFRLGIWIVMHENLRGSRRMRAMFDHLVEGVTAYVKDSHD